MGNEREDDRSKPFVRVRAGFEKPKKEEDRGQVFFWGVVLMALGVVFLLAQQGILPRDVLWSWEWWPAVLIGLGLVKLVRARDASDVGSGVTMMLFGVWFFANIFDWWGLTYRTSWPLALVAVGGGMVARALAAVVMRDAGDRPANDARGKESSRVE